MEEFELKVTISQVFLQKLHKVNKIQTAEHFKVVIGRHFHTELVLCLILQSWLHHAGGGGL